MKIRLLGPACSHRGLIFLATEHTEDTENKVKMEYRGNQGITVNTL